MKIFYRSLIDSRIKIDRNVSWPGFYSKIVDPKELRNLWAIDASDSVSDHNFYHNQLKRILDEYGKPDDEYYLWSNDIEKVTLDELHQFINNKKGRYGTKSSLIEEIAHLSNIKEHLIIVTDGSVDQNEIDKSDELVNKYNINFLYVTTFIINNGFPAILEEYLKYNYLPAQLLEPIKIKSDLSVCCPYCRKCPSITYNIKGENEIETLFNLASSELNICKDIDNICTLQKFVDNYDQLLNGFKKITHNQSNIDNLGKMIDSLYLRVMRNISTSEQQRYFEDRFNDLL